MNKLVLIFSVTLFFSGTFSWAETLTVPSYTIPNSSEGILRPTRGMSKTKVEQKFGKPEKKSAPVGDPPITKWAYPDFVVFFEYNYVIHSVIPR